MGRIVIAAYKPKAGQHEALAELMREHLTILRSQDLVTERESIMMQAEDGTILEVFEWRSAEAIASAHENPAVLAMWEKYAAACDYIPVGQVPEADILFSDYTPFA